MSNASTITIPLGLAQALYVVCDKAYNAGVLEADAVGEMLYLEGYNNETGTSSVCTKKCCKE